MVGDSNAKTSGMMSLPLMNQQTQVLKRITTSYHLNKSLQSIANSEIK